MFVEVVASLTKVNFMCRNSLSDANFYSFFMNLVNIQRILKIDWLKCSLHSGAFTANAV